MYGNMAARNWIQSFTQLMAQATAAGVKFGFVFLGNESLIQRARNRLVDDFLKVTDSTHAVFIDADIGFNPHEVLAMLECDLDICGAACTKKSTNWLRIQEAIKQKGPIFTADQLAMIGGDFVVNWDHVGRLEFNTNTPVEVKHLGTGLLMIKREVFMKFREEFPDRWYEGRGDPQAQPGPIGEFFRTGIDPISNTYLSEDYCFCVDAQTVGYKIWLCPWVRTTHMGSYEFIADLPSLAAMKGKL